MIAAAINYQGKQALIGFLKPQDKRKFYQFIPNAKLLIENYEAELKQTADFSEEESLEISGISM